MKNLDLVKGVLKNRFPEDAAKIEFGDADFICNRFLCGNQQRSRVASELGLGNDKCHICSRGKQEECPFRLLPLNHCRNGILEWLDGSPS